jgi:phytoene dehydrogenase-like protein
MARSAAVDAIVIGAGPNGLTAAVTMAKAGLGVRVYEGAQTVGGGARTEELTLPGFRHDICSAVHPLGAGSPVFRALPLEDHGLKWIYPPVALAHPQDDGDAATLVASLDATAESLDADAGRYRALVKPFIGHWADLSADSLRPIAATWPRNPLLLARFGIRGLAPVSWLAALMRGQKARAFLAGLAGHAIAPLNSLATGGVATLFAVAGHEVGWPFPQGGSQAITDALASLLRSLGGEVITDHRVGSLDDLPATSAYVLDVAPWDVGSIVDGRVPSGYIEKLARWPHAPGVFKIDYALSGPVPWRDDRCRQAGTVHLGGSYEEIAGAIQTAVSGSAPTVPFLITAQQSLFDSSRAPDGKHTFWAYGHVPIGWTGDFTDAMERQIERFAPGFRDLVIGRAAAGAAQLEARNPNNAGGDIAGGAFSGHRAFFRPVNTPVPYATPNPAIFLCSSSTPPGPGVHGMCGYHAARVVLHRVFGRTAALP